MKPTDPKLFDQRIVKRNIQQGLIKEEDHQKFLKSLPDEKNNYEEVPFEEEEEKAEEKKAAPSA